MRVDKWEFVWEFSQLSCPGQTRTRVVWELMGVDKREFVWVFSQLSCPGQTRTIVAWELMRIDKREFVWEFSQLSCTAQTRTRVTWEFVRVDEWEFVWEFSQLSCPGQWSNENKDCIRVATLIDSHQLLPSFRWALYCHLICLIWPFKFLSNTMFSCINPWMKSLFTDVVRLLQKEETTW